MCLQQVEEWVTCAQEDKLFVTYIHNKLETAEERVRSVANLGMLGTRRLPMQKKQEIHVFE